MNKMHHLEADTDMLYEKGKEDEKACNKIKRQKK